MVRLRRGKRANNSIARDTITNTWATEGNRETTITEPNMAALRETGAENLKRIRKEAGPGN
jgi:hypothetical protein